MQTEYRQPGLLPAAHEFRELRRAIRSHWRAYNSPTRIDARLWDHTIPSSTVKPTGSSRHRPATFTSMHLVTLHAVAAYLPSAENHMDDRILSGALFVVLSAVFGRHGIGALLTAYHTGDRTAWTEQAIQGGLGVTTADIATSPFS